MELNYHYNSNEEIISLVHNMFEKHGINQKGISPKRYLEYVFDEINNQIMPNIIFSDELPNKKIDDYSTDGLMGAYSPESRSITIYLQGIEKARNKLLEVYADYYEENETNLYADLIKIVILHELGHYFFHNMDFKSLVCREESQPFAAVFLNEMIDEWVAQSFTYQCVENESNLLDVLVKLANEQKLHYKTFLQENLKNYLHKEKWKPIISYLQFFNVKVKLRLTEVDKNQINDLKIALEGVEGAIRNDNYGGNF